MSDKTASVLSIVAIVAYDGTDYCGFQYQVEQPTIQGSLEDALGAFAQYQGRIVGSGRTDTGVHAQGQVILAKVYWRHHLSDLQRAWNAHLPSSIGIEAVAQAPEGFHPRFSARARTYRYWVYQQVPEVGIPQLRRAPLKERYVLLETRMLDLEAMNHAAASLIGEYDFATFGQPPDGDKTIRRIIQAEWQVVVDNLTKPASAGRMIVFTITANAFLRHMVRNIVGTLLEVGRQERTVSEITRALEACDRTLSGAPVPPQGLVLERVSYPDYPALFT